MQGHIRKRGNKWCFVVEIGRDPITNKRQQKWYSGFRTKKEAQTKLTEILQQLNTNNFADSKNVIVEDFLNMWLKDYAKQSVSTNTYESYRLTIKNHLIPHLGKYKLEKLNPSIIQSFYTYCIENTDLSNTSVLYNHKVLRQALKHAVKWQLINKNPCDGVEPPKKDEHEAVILDEKQINEVLNVVKGHPVHTPIFIALTTGMRRGEISGLQWEDIDFNKKLIYVRHNLSVKEVLSTTKTSKSKRPIAMLNSLVSYLKEVRKKQIENRLLLGSDYIESNYVCTWEDGKVINPDYLSKKFKKIVDKLNIKGVRFHDLRHTHATLLLKEGIHPKIVSERLGHSKISITMDIYSHVIPEMQKEAADKLEEKLFKNIN